MREPTRFTIRYGGNMPFSASIFSMAKNHHFTPGASGSKLPAPEITGAVQHRGSHRGIINSFDRVRKIGKAVQASLIERTALIVAIYAA
jgi:hypothetical protein